MITWKSTINRLNTLIDRIPMGYVWMFMLVVSWMIILSVMVSIARFAEYVFQVVG